MTIDKKNEIYKLIVYTIENIKLLSRTLKDDYTRLVTVEASSMEMADKHFEIAECDMIYGSLNKLLKLIEDE